MRTNRNAVEHRDLPPKVAGRASEERSTPLRHANWMQQFLGRAPPRHDLRTLGRRVKGEARPLRAQVGRLGRRLIA